MDEEILSITNWLCGGKTMLLDLECAHLYRLQQDIPYKLTQENICGVWANRFTLLMAIPVPEPDMQELSDWLKKNGDVKDHFKNITALLDLQALDDQRQYLKIQERSFSQWKEIFITEGDDDMKKHRKFETRSSGTQTMEVPPGTNATLEKKKYVTNCIVKDLGCPCLHCGAKHDHKVTNTYPNGNRRMICNSCGLPFMAVRAV
jgi:hypothetical protein